MVATIALDMLRGLEYMHSHSMLHRDVKVCTWSSAVQSHEDPLSCSPEGHSQPQRSLFARNAPRMEVMQCHASYSGIPVPAEMQRLSAGRGPAVVRKADMSSGTVRRRQTC